ncbi:MAG TPA: substrate-binding domain-containing protein [Candidatus Limnocylindrales bacterium]|nr:substrate-binding domain-containing protein [Candidatus Limnocylindrales bacterium]
MTFSSTKRIGGLALAATMFVAACGGGAATTAPATTAPATAAPATAAPATEAPAESPAESMAAGVSGSIFVTGSSTVEPISTGVAEAMKAANADFNFTVEGPGTGDGFKKFCAGEADIADASRAIKDEEAKACADAGIEYVELKIAIDGMSVLTSVNNTAVACLSFPDLYALMGPESTGFAKWSDGAAIAKELGSNTVLPDADLKITGPGEESGTFDSFVELALAKIAEARGKEPNTRPDYTASANDNAIIDGIAGSDTSLGWVGFAFAEENKDKVGEIQVSKEANGTCVAPTPETIADGSYPLSRPLFIYVNKAKAAENAAIGAYVDFYLAEGTIATVLETVPYVNLAPEALAETRAAWDAAK